jgi:hypothetical protein
MARNSSRRLALGALVLSLTMASGASAAPCDGKAASGEAYRAVIGTWFGAVQSPAWLLITVHNPDPNAITVVFDDANQGFSTFDLCGDILAAPFTTCTSSGNIPSGATQVFQFPMGAPGGAVVSRVTVNSLSVSFKAPIVSGELIASRVDPNTGLVIDYRYYDHVIYQRDGCR